jgi:hypothetical protein
LGNKLKQAVAIGALKGKVAIATMVTAPEQPCKTQPCTFIVKPTGLRPLESKT